MYDYMQVLLLIKQGRTLLVAQGQWGASEGCKLKQWQCAKFSVTIKPVYTIKQAFKFLCRNNRFPSFGKKIKPSVLWPWFIHALTALHTHMCVYTVCVLRGVKGAGLLQQ